MPALRQLGLILGLCAAVCAPLPAQEAAHHIVAEVRPLVGGFVPIGRLRDDLRAAPLYGLAGALEMNPSFHVVASGYLSSVNAKAGTATAAAEIWQFDAGIEFHLVPDRSDQPQLRPFAGAGAGTRAYDYSASGVATTAHDDMYVASGLDLQQGAFAGRFETRWFAGRYASPTTGRHGTRSDLAIMLGLVVHFH